MIADKMKGMVANSSAIRAMFEEGNRLASLYGAENVYDFSLGNPNVPAPEAVKKAIVALVEGEDPIALHGYTNSNSGYPEAMKGKQWENREEYIPVCYTVPRHSFFIDVYKRQELLSMKPKILKIIWPELLKWLKVCKEMLNLL